PRDRLAPGGQPGRNAGRVGTAALAAARADLRGHLPWPADPQHRSRGNLFAVAFPLGFISSVFAPPDMMPGWPGAVAAWNPVSSTANAIRERFHTPGSEVFQTSYWIDGVPIAGAVAWPIVVMAVFLPLAVRQYRNLSK